MKPFSATEIDAARGCLRKWAFRYASDVPKPPQGPGAALGSEGHAIVESYLRDGKVPANEGIGALVRAGLPYLPSPGAGKVEVRSTVEILGVPFVRVLDWTGKVSELPGVAEDARSGAAVAQLDHKFSKDPRRYGLWSDEDFLGNVQTLVYRLSEGPVSVLQRWLYYPTSGPRRVKPSDHVIGYGEAQESFKRIVLPVINAIDPWRGRKVDPNDIPGNAGHCDAYGGCDYRKMGLCSMTTGNVVANYFLEGDDDIMATPDNSIWKKLSLNGGNAAAAPVAATAPAAAPEAPKPFTFNFPPPATAAPEPVLTPAPPPIIEAEVAPVAERPKRQRAPRAEEAPSIPLAVQADAMQAAYASEIVARIGRAMIAAGKVLAGEP